jgi:FlaA1/EpsC-like NDP-sugar epimerase
MSDKMPDLLLRYRRPLVVVAHIGIWAAAYALAYLFRFDFRVPAPYFTAPYVAWWVVLLALRLVAYAYYGLFQDMWKYTGQRDLVDLVKATGVSSAGWALMLLFVGVYPVPRTVMAAEFLLTVALVGGVRFANRTFAQATRSMHGAPGRRMLIVGAGDAGESLLREALRSMKDRVQPVGFLDDNPLKQKMLIHGVPVLGTVDDAQNVIEAQSIAEVVIATPQATGKQMRRILDAVRSPGVTVRTVPSMEHLIDGRVTINQLREVDIEDLLGRDPVQLDSRQVGDMLRNEVILVTGAGGSIGSELCRQALRFQPRQLVLVEQAENALYHIHRELRLRYPDADIVPVIADITDKARLDVVFREHQPGLVLHAAAHKHVPMMEWNPTEAVKNNVGGTRTIADLAHEHRCRRFVMISTDKAVNPTSVMGCTKRVAELYVQAQAQRSKTRFATVRFGNVLGSNGSVIPLFRSQIAKGGPVTVTHPEMQRYFMTIPEASQLVLQAGAIATSGEVYVLDMGEPVRIVTLAEDLIRLSGLEPGVDVEITFTGTRPGEKLFEELSWDEENADKTTHEKIFVGRGEPRPVEVISGQVDGLLTELDGKHPADVRRALKVVVPEFKSPEDGEKVDDSRKVIPIR